MGIEIQQPGMARLYGAAAVISKGEREAQRKREEQARKEEIQMQQQYQQNMKMLDAQLDLEMYERSKRWEIDKMELRSQVDFQREEQQRQRKLDSADNAIQQIDKEVLAGRMTEQEAYPLKQKLELNKIGVNVPVSAFAPADEDKYGVQPYWMRGRESPEGTPERQLYEAKMAEQISGERRGVVPYYLDPTFIGNYPEAARQAQEARGIFLSDEEFNALRERPGIEMPTIPTERPGVEVGEVSVISPTGEEGTIPIEDLEEALAEGYTRVSEESSEIVPPVTEDIVKQLEAGEAKFYKPSLKTFATMSPLRYLMERRKAKKLLRK